MESQQLAPSFFLLSEIEGKSGQPISRCYQCKKCTGGCPMNFAMEVQPSQAVRYIQLGIKEQLLKCNSIWICTSCKTCKSRCPNGIDCSSIFDVLKEMVVSAGKIADDNQKIKTFHDTFLSSIQSNGRVFEAGMLMNYKLKTKTYTQDMSLGLQMFKKGKIKLLPEKIHQKREINGIFRKAKEKSR